MDVDLIFKIAAIGIIVTVLAAAACLGAGILMFRRAHHDRC